MTASRITLIVTVALSGCVGNETADRTSLSELGPRAELQQVAVSMAPLGNVVAIVADSSGNIYVAESESQEIVVLSADGHEIGRIGGKGDGPGEFASLQSIAWKSDTLVALDVRNRRITLFTRAGDVVSTTAWPSEAGRPRRLLPAGRAVVATGTFPRGFSAPVATAAEGAARFRQPEVRYFELTGTQLRRLDVQDTLAEPPGFDCDGPGGTIASFGDPFFGARGPLRGFLSPNELVRAASDSARLDFVNASGEAATRSITLESAQIQVSDSLWVHETSAYRARERREGPFSCDLEAMRPATLPRIRSLVIDPGGRIWVEVRLTPDRFAFVVLDASGSSIAAAAAPPRDALVAPYARGDTLYVVQKDGYDVQSVVTYELQFKQ